MDKKFVLIDLREIKSKNNSKFYIARVYCNLGFLRDIFISKEAYDLLINSVYSDVSCYVYERYDKKSDGIIYYIDIK